MSKWKGSVGEAFEVTTTTTKTVSDKDIKRAMYVIIAALIIDILILIFGIRAIFMCQNAGKWNVYISVLLILGLFVPYLSIPLAIFLIVYANVACKSGTLRLRK
jgi:uncharacterized membrane protein YphA (DoxX/SURF4 family)